MNLVFDIGNSNIKAGYFKNNQLIRKEVLPTDFYHWDEIIHPECKAVLLAGSGKLLPEIEEPCQKLGIFFHRLSIKSKIPIANSYETPETLGHDRLAAAVGACTLFDSESLLIIDAGTAITYDLVLNQTFMGGNISPGLSLRFKALNIYTERLPLVSPPKETDLYGKNTFEAIAFGVVNGLIYEIDQTIEIFSQKHKGIKILATGGDAQYFENKIKKTIFVEPNLVLIGLNRILQENV